MMSPSEKLCLAALAQDSLVRHHRMWRTGRRGFAFKTVAGLISRGLARRIGDRVVGVIPVNDNGPA